MACGAALLPIQQRAPLLGEREQLRRPLSEKAAANHDRGSSSCRASPRSAHDHPLHALTLLTEVSSVRVRRPPGDLPARAHRCGGHASPGSRRGLSLPRRGRPSRAVRQQPRHRGRCRSGIAPTTCRRAPMRRGAHRGCRSERRSRTHDVSASADAAVRAAVRPTNDRASAQCVCLKSHFAVVTPGAPPRDPPTRFDSPTTHPPAGSSPTRGRVEPHRSSHLRGFDTCSPY